MCRYPSSCTALMLLCLFLGTAAQAQTIWHVDDDASMGGNGLAWQTAYQYLQDALASATYGDEIRVAGGTYTADQDESGNVTPGDRAATFRLISGVEVFGGYRGLAGGGDGDDRDPALFETILSGDLNADDHSGGDSTENSYQVVTGSGTSATALLDGFTITAGNADGPDIYPLFPNRGGGMYNFRGSPTVMNCTFSNNRAALGGGGLNNEQSDPTLINCVFRGNTAFFSGGGIRGWESGPTLFNCVFTGNTAESGGVAWHGASTAAYTNCTFSSNSAPLGSALGFDSCCPQQPSNVTLANCVLWDGGSEIRNFDGSTITITYSDVQDADPNDASVYPGLGNIDDDPRFVDADGSDNIPGTGDDNLRLMPDSPCSDAGDNTALPPGVTTDLEGNPRFIDNPDAPDTGNGPPPIVDMGAYEFFTDCNENDVPDLLETDTDGDGMIDDCEDDDDNDGVLDGADLDSINPYACEDVDQDSCDDCAVGADGFGPLADNDPANDGPDNDGDGTCNAGDDCPNDPNKISPGICGCGTPDQGDEDQDGVLDCLDQCPGVDDATFAPECREAIPTVSAWGLIVLTLLILTGGKLYFGWGRGQVT